MVGGVLAVTGDGGERRRRAATAAARGGGVGTGDSEVRILNWQAYIDPTEDGAVGTIDRFQDATGIAVTYSEDFNDNNEVYNRILAPILGTGGVIDFDIICPTNWMAARLQTLALARAAAARPHPQPGQPRGPLPQPAVGLPGRVQPAVAGRDHRHRLQPGAHRARADAA